MSIDIVLTIEELSFLIAGIALVFLISRAIIIGRKFISRVYKSRAFWFAGVMVVALILVLADLISALFGLYPSTSLAFLGIVSFLTWVLVLFVYADRTILVTLEMDFLHRNTLHWRQIRTIFYVVIFASVFWFYPYIFVTRAPTCSSGLCPTVYAPGVPAWVPVIFPGILAVGAVLAIIVIFGYTISALIIAARRTSDMTMKRHVRWMGLSFLIFLGFFVAFTLPTELGDLLGSIVILVLVYTYYRVLMSLTVIGKVGKVEKEIKN